MRIMTSLISLATIALGATNVLAQGSGGTPSPDPIPSWATGAYNDSDTALRMTLSIGEHWPPPGTAPLGPVYTSDYYTIPEDVDVPIGARPGGYRLYIGAEDRFPAPPLQVPPTPIDSCLELFFQLKVQSTTGIGHYGIISLINQSGLLNREQMRDSISPLGLSHERPVPPCLLVGAHPGVDTSSPAFTSVVGSHGSGCYCLGPPESSTSPDMTGVPDRTEDPELWAIYDRFILKVAAVDYWWCVQISDEVDWNDPNWFAGLADANAELHTLVENDYITELLDHFYED